MNENLEWKYQSVSNFDEANKDFNEVMESACIFMSSKIVRLCNDGKYEDAYKLEEALKTIINTDFSR